MGGGGTIIPIKDCQYKGGHPNLNPARFTTIGLRGASHTAYFAKQGPVARLPLRLGLLLGTPAKLSFASMRGQALGAVGQGGSGDSHSELRGILSPAILAIPQRAVPREAGSSRRKELQVTDSVPFGGSQVMCSEARAASLQKQVWQPTIRKMNS